jgi:hypothetical protein
LVEQAAKPHPDGRSPVAVLLLSDGAQTAGDIRPGPAVQPARRLGVPVSTVALGTGDAVVEVPCPAASKERVVVAPDRNTLRLVPARRCLFSQRSRFGFAYRAEQLPPAKLEYGPQREVALMT